MEISVANQSFVFISFILGGMLVGFVYDIFRILRRVIKTPNFVIYLEDILFWIIVTFIIFALVFVVNYGELRWYEFLGVILGVLFYNLLFSNYIVRASVAIINFFKKVFLVIFKIIVFPFYIIYKILLKPCGLLIYTLTKGIYKLSKFIGSIFTKKVCSFKNLKIMKKKI